MSVLQIILLIIGGVLFVLSFFVGDGRRKDDKNSYLEDRELQNAAQSTLDEAGSKLSDMVEETVQYAMEKSERVLERLSNEKIMALSEYSDAIMTDMEKSHKEIVFLYDMLNEKTTALKNSIREAEDLRKNFDKANANLASDNVEAQDKEINIKKVEDKIIRQTEELIDVENKTNTSIPDIYGGDNNSNKNEKVLSLHNEGKSNVAIAKELGLGVGEVKLVIDLFKGAK